MATPYSEREMHALSSHRFLMRTALAASMSFAWVFALQYLYGLYGNISDAFLRIILLYELTQVITILLTPYSAEQLKNGMRSRMMAGVFVCILSFVFFGAALNGLVPSIFGLLIFAIGMGVYRAFYWTPYALEKDTVSVESPLPQEILIAIMPLVVGYSLVNGYLGAAMILFTGATLLVASLAPLFSVKENAETYVWGYRETFGELFEPKYNPIVETSFLAGVQGAALLLLWPLTIFVIVGLSYTLFGLVLTATLLLAILFRDRGQRIMKNRDVVHVAVAASAWIFRLAVASPLSVVLVSAYASPTDTPADLLTLEQAADSGTYLDEYTVLKELSQGLGRIALCIAAAVCISEFSLPIGLGVAFLLAAGASAVSVLNARSSPEIF